MKFEGTKNISSEIAAANKDLEFEFLKMYDLAKRPAGSWKGENRKTLKTLPEDYKTYAILTGRIYVIDCDRPKKEGDPDGLEKFLSLLADLGLENLEEQTLVVDTPNEGKHYYFRTDEELPSKISNTALGAGIDIRAQDALIVGPGSKGKNRKGEVKEYLISSSTLEIAELPNEIFEALNSSKEKTPIKKQESNNSKKESKDTAPSTNNISSLLSELILAKEGERNSTLYKLSATAGSKGIDEAIASRLIYAGISIGLEETEARKTFQSGYSKGVEEFRERNTAASEVPEQYKDADQVTFYSDSNLKSLIIEEASSKFLRHKGTLYSYDRGQWVPEDDETGLYNFIEEKLLLITDKVSLYFDKEALTKVRARLASLGDYSKISSVMRSIISSITNNSADLLDNDKHLALAQNCVINLKTGEALEFSPDYYMSCRLGAEYRPEIGTSLAEPYFNFIEPKHKGLLLAFLGQALTGNNGESMLTLLGEGSNGKSFFFQVLGEIFGNYYTLLDSNSFYAKKSDRDSKMTLQGKRLALVEELCSNPEDVIDAGILKSLIGTPDVTGRGIYEKTKSFKSKVSIIASSNELPRFSSNKTLKAEERRLLVASCPFTYVSNPTSRHERKKDYRLEKELYSNTDVRASILNLIVINSVNYYKDIDNFINNSVPDSVRNLVKDWLSKDKIQEPFLRGFEITGDPKDVVPLVDMFLYFSEETDIKLSDNMIGNLLSTSKFIRSQTGIEIVRDHRRIPSDSRVTHYKGNNRKINMPGSQAYHVRGVAAREEIRKKDTYDEDLI